MCSSGYVWIKGAVAVGGCGWSRWVEYVGGCG